jgi:protein-tyrosine phosphatase
VNRALPFKRVHNFRDLGGYLTSSGQSIRWNRLFRSGHLARMRKPDLELFRSLDIHTVVDFRSPGEKKRKPNRLPRFHDIRTVSLPMLDPVHSSMAQEFRSRLISRDYRGFDPLESITRMYQSFATECSKQYQRFVHTVLEAQGQPVLWHCTAGKDRAGFAAAILLRLLDVPQETVIEDYMLSADYADRKELVIFLLKLARGQKGLSVIQPLLTVHRKWIEASFRAIDDRWGSFAEYTDQALALSLDDIAQLQRLLLDTT